MSPPLRIAVVEPLPDWIRALYADQLPADEFALIWPDDAGAVGAIPSDGCDVLLTGKRRIGQAEIDAAGPGLRLIQVIGRAPWAVDHDAAARADVAVSLLPHRGAIAVAEHALSLVLAVYRRLVDGHRDTASAAYRGLGLTPIETDERTIAFNWMKYPDVRQLFGKTIGLVGLGDIGLETARRARAFDMQVVYCKREPLPDGIDTRLGLRRAPFEELLAVADVISLHVPHGAETERMIDGSSLARAKDDAVLVNTSRGGLVDEPALAAWLRDHPGAGAGLDVFLHEPFPEGHELAGLPNVVLSPHVGGGTGGGQKGMAGDVAANLRRVADGGPPAHVVDGTGGWP